MVKVQRLFAKTNLKILVYLSFGGVYFEQCNQKICLVILGLLQGTLGSYLALLGWAFAFPETSPGAKDYVEDMSFVPLGYFIMFAWLAIMITAMILFRKNKANFLSFILPWFMGLVACLVAVFVIL